MGSTFKGSMGNILTTHVGNVWSKPLIPKYKIGFYGEKYSDVSIENAATYVVLQGIRRAYTWFISNYGQTSTHNVACVFQLFRAQSGLMQGSCLLVA